MNILTSIPPAARSTMWYITGGFSKSYLRKDRMGELYNMESRGQFRVFRESVGKIDCPDEPITLVFGFRLKIFSSVPILHWIFQKICIITTPFWSGFEGFKVKLWLIDPETKNYLGIYDWRGKPLARKYIDFLTPLLKLASVKGSVWHKIHDIGYEEFLREHAIADT